MGFLQISHAVKYQLTGASERVVILIRLLGSIVKHGTFRTSISSANKTNRHNLTEILLKVALNTIDQTKYIL
jgi:hypothetical protein